MTANEVHKSESYYQKDFFVIRLLFKGALIIYQLFASHSIKKIKVSCINIPLLAKLITHNMLQMNVIVAFIGGKMNLNKEKKNKQ